MPIGGYNRFLLPLIQRSTCFAQQVERGKILPSVRFHLNLFYIERGLYSRTEIGEREINGSTVPSRNAVIQLFAPPPPSSWPDKRRHLVSYLTLSPLSPCPPSHPNPIEQFCNCSGRSWGWPLIWRLWVWQLKLDRNSDYVRIFGSVIGCL